MENKSYKHWIVLLTCCGLAASSIGISINSSGIFYTPVSDDLGILRGSFSMHMTIFSLMTACGAFITPKLMKKISYKIILAISVAIAVIATAAMGFVTTIPMFYILGAIRGLSTCMFSIVPLTMIINEWFDEKHGFATSLVFGFSGLAGTICSPILSSCIESFGWQTSYVIKAAVILVLCLPAILYPYHLNPRQDHLLPYGYVEKQVDTKKKTTTFSFVSMAFIAFFIFGLMCSCITSVTQHFPGYAQSLEYSASVGAMLLSAGMIGNIVSKLIVGILSDILGAMKATLLMLMVNGLGVVFLMIARPELLLVVGAFLFGSSYGIGAVCVPLLTKYFFGADKYDRVFPSISFGSNIGAAISLSMVGYIYDFFGSYMIAFLLALAMLVIAIVLLVITSKSTKKGA